jgi:hypothetical protein
MPRLGHPETMKIVVVPAGFLTRHVAGQETRRHGGIASPPKEPRGTYPLPARRTGPRRIVGILRPGSSR